MLRYIKQTTYYKFREKISMQILCELHNMQKMMENSTDVKRKAEIPN